MQSTWGCYLHEILTRVCLSESMCMRSALSVTLSFDSTVFVLYIPCSKDLKERHTFFPFIAVLITPKFNSHLKAIQNDPECPLHTMHRSH